MQRFCNLCAWVRTANSSANVVLAPRLPTALFPRDKLIIPMATIQRRKTFTAVVGGVRVGSDASIVVQSMTNTDTADIDGTIRQCAALARAGSELVRVTVNNDAAAAAVPHIVDGLDRLGGVIVD